MHAQAWRGQYTRQRPTSSGPIGRLWRPPCGRTHRASPMIRASLPAAADATTAENLIEGFWKARGVFDPLKRQELVKLSVNIAHNQEGLEAAAAAAGDLLLEEGQSLPGIPSTWSDGMESTEIAEVARRLVRLHSVLGGADDIDVIWMVVREPRLLNADPQQLMQRLMQMKLAAAGSSIDVVKVSERHPSLLLSEELPWNSPQTLQERLEAWESGVLSDSDPEWQQRLEGLIQYHRQHGDCGVGFREADDADLARWASLQRRQSAKGQLSEEKREALEQLGFEFDEEEAEWLRWFLDLARFKERWGHASPMPLAAGADMYLINWCSVQRVAYRCKILSERRLGLMDSIGFDWTGADPLS